VNEKCLLLSPDGKTLLRGGAASGSALWDVAGKKKIGLPFDPGGVATASAFSPDGQRVLVSSAVRSPDDGRTPGVAAWNWVLWLGERGEWKRTGPPGQQGQTFGIAFGPGGRTVLLGNGDGTARLWDVDTWQPLGPVLAHPGLQKVLVDGHASSSIAGVQQVALSPDGRTGLTAGENQGRLWDTPTGQSLGAPLVHQDRILVGTFSPDGSLVATGSADKTVRLWNASTGAQVGPPLHHADPVRVVAFSRDGRTLLTSDADGVGRFWDCATGKPLGLPMFHQRCRSAVFCPDGQTVLTASGISGGTSGDCPFQTVVCRWAVPPPPREGTVPRLVLWAQLTTGRNLDAANVVGWLTPQAWQAGRRRLEELGGPFPPTTDGLAWHRREVEFCIDSQSWSAALWHLERLLKAEPNAWKHHFDRGRVHFFKSRSGSFEEKERLEEMQQAVADWTEAIALGAEGYQVWGYRGEASDALRQWDRADDDFEKAVALGSDFHLFRQAEAQIKSGNTEAYKRTWAALLARFGQSRDPVQGLNEAAKELEGLNLPSSQNGHFLLAMAHHRLGHAAEAWQQLTQASLTPPPGEGAPESLRGEAEALFGIRRFRGHTDRVWCVAFSPDGSRALTGGWDQTVRLWDVRGGKQIRLFDCRHEGQNQAIYAVAFSPDGRRALAGSAHGTAWLWDLETGKELNRCQFGPGGQWDPGIAGMAFSPDGRKALMGGHAGVIHVWDLEHWKELRRLEHGVGLWSVDFSPRGRLAVSAGGFEGKGLVRLWDVDTGKEVRRFEGHTAGLWPAVFSPDGRQVLSGGTDHTMRLWDVETGKQLRLFHGHTNDVWSVSCSRSGRRALSASNDGTARLWDLATGKELRRFVGNTAAISPDGRHALSGTPDGAVWLWPLPPEDR
jgi:WD40 repeat protein